MAAAAASPLCLQTTNNNPSFLRGRLSVCAAQHCVHSPPSGQKLALFHLRETLSLYLAAPHGRLYYELPLARLPPPPAAAAAASLSITLGWIGAVLRRRVLIRTPQLPVSDLVQLHLKTNWGDAS